MELFRKMTRKWSKISELYNFIDQATAYIKESRQSKILVKLGAILTNMYRIHLNTDLLLHNHQYTRRKKAKHSSMNYWAF